MLIKELDIDINTDTPHAYITDNTCFNTEMILLCDYHIINIIKL